MGWSTERLQVARTPASTTVVNVASPLGPQLLDMRFGNEFCAAKEREAPDPLLAVLADPLPPRNRAPFKLARVGG